MRGYVYIDLDDKLHVRTEDFINNVDPGFFGRNRLHIRKYWLFDTTDFDSMTNLLKTFGKDNLNLSTSEVLCFLTNTGVTPEDLKNLKNANKV